MGKAHAMGFYSLLLRFFAVGRILESDIFNIGFSETIDASNVFVGYKYPTYISICLVNVHCSVGFAHDNGG